MERLKQQMFEHIPIAEVVFKHFLFQVLFKICLNKSFDSNPKFLFEVLLPWSWTVDVTGGRLQETRGMERCGFGPKVCDKKNV